MNLIQSSTLHSLYSMTINGQELFGIAINEDHPEQATHLFRTLDSAMEVFDPAVYINGYKLVTTDTLFVITDKATGKHVLSTINEAEMLACIYSH
ncbi:MAG: hypothetical protein PF440_01115 [Thiomicrorhabdus sp.]|jgi:hypothetical protein|nr:hypothetical protein [Thiomicrorhabdus sp.]